MYDAIYSFHAGYPATDDNFVFSISKTRFELWTENTIKMNTVMQNDDVYTVFDPTKHKIFATSYSDYKIETENNLAKKITIHQNDGKSVNLRYGFNSHQENSTNSSGAYGNITNWTMTDVQSEIFRNMMTTNQYVYQFYAPFSTYKNRLISANGSDYYNMTTDPSFIIDMNRQLIFTAVQIGMGYCDNSRNNYISSMNVPISQLIEWSKSTNRIYEYNGQRVFVTSVNIRNYFKTGNGYSSNLTRHNIATGTDTQNYQCYNSIFPFIETYAGDKLIHHNAPMSCMFNWTVSGNNINALYRGSAGNYDNPFYGDWYQSLNHTSANSITSISTLTNADDGDNYANGIYLYGNDPLELELSDTAVYNKSGSVELNGGYTIACQNFGEYSWGWYISITHITSLAEIFATLASMLIPFYITESTANTPSQSFDTFIGIRSSGGHVVGDWEKYNWENPQTEKNFRPDDFEPIIPTPGTPVEPDIDMDGKDTGTVAPAGKVTLGATNGFVTYYALSPSQLRAIGKSLWGNTNPSEVLKNFFFLQNSSSDVNYELSYSEILDYFISLKYFPFNIPAYADTQSTGEQGIRIGTGATLIDAGPIISTEIITNPIAEIDGGTCTVPSYYNSFMDNEPIAVASLYVPFCGTTELQLSAITDKPLTLTYYVDMVTGCCVALIQANSVDGVYPVAELTGVIGFDMMLTGNNNNQQLSSIVSSLKHTAVNSMGSIASAVGGAASKSGRQIMSGIVNAASDVANTAIDMPQTAALHPMISGTSSSLASLASYHVAFIQIKRKNSITPLNFGSTVGYIANQTITIGRLTGFTQCVNPDLTGIAATTTELEMIRDLLTSGFYA